jgi:Fibronectin type III domain
MDFQKQVLKPATVAGPLKHKIPAHVWLKCWGVSFALLWHLPVTAAPPTSSVTLTWNPNPSPAIAGYNIYSGGISGIYTNKISADNTTSVTLSNLVVGSIYYFAATCYDAAGDESAFSNEAVYTVPPDTTGLPIMLGNPSVSGGNFSFTVASTTGDSSAVEVSVDMINWVRIQTNTAPFTFVDTNSSQFSCRFYRTVKLP